MDKTETKEMEGEKCDCGGSIIMFTADLDVCNKCWRQYEPKATRDILKENQSLRSELQKAKELNGELVNAIKGLVSQRSFRGGFPHTTNELESLIKKSNP